VVRDRYARDARKIEQAERNWQLRVAPGATMSYADVRRWAAFARAADSEDTAASVSVLPWNAISEVSC
jgi:hypothetical protein